MKRTNSNETEPNKDSKDKKVKVYSEYGYIDVSNHDYCDEASNFVNFEKTKQGLHGRISKLSLSENITINLKTLYGSRKVYNFEVNINSRLNTLIDKLMKEEENNKEEQRWKPGYQYRLISTNGIIKEIDPSMTFYEEEIKNNFTLILASPYKIFFSDKMKHTGIQVSYLIIYISLKTKTLLLIIYQVLKII